MRVIPVLGALPRISTVGAPARGEKAAPAQCPPASLPRFVIRWPPLPPPRRSALLPPSRQTPTCNIDLRRSARGDASRSTDLLLPICPRRMIVGPTRFLLDISAREVHSVPRPGEAIVHTTSRHMRVVSSRNGETSRTAPHSREPGRPPRGRHVSSPE